MFPPTGNPQCYGIIIISKQKYENNPVHCCRNVCKITIDNPTQHNGFCDRIATSLHNFTKFLKFLLQQSVRQNSWGTSTQRCFFFFFQIWPISSSSQCFCIAVNSPNLTLFDTNTGRARRQESVPTVLTEIVPISVVMQALTTRALVDCISL